MRLLIRNLIAATTLLSFLLCLALVTLWVRSYWGTDYAARTWFAGADAHTSRSEGQRLSITRGQVRFTLEENTGYHHGNINLDNLPPIDRPQWYVHRLGEGHTGWEAPTRTFWERRGFAAWDSGWTSSFADSNDRNWGAPVWPAVLLTAILPALYTRHSALQGAKYLEWAELSKAKVGFVAMPFVKEQSK